MDPGLLPPPDASVLADAARVAADAGLIDPVSGLADSKMLVSQRLSCMTQLRCSLALYCMVQLRIISGTSVVVLVARQAVWVCATSILVLDVWCL
jgi:hypothetical protein